MCAHLAAEAFPTPRNRGGGAVGREEGPRGRASLHDPGPGGMSKSEPGCGDDSDVITPVEYRMCASEWNIFGFFNFSGYLEYISFVYIIGDKNLNTFFCVCMLVWLVSPGWGGWSTKRSPFAALARLASPTPKPRRDTCGGRQPLGNPT